MSSKTFYFHTRISKYFADKPLYLDQPTKKKPNIRKLVEQPWQQTKGDMRYEVAETLSTVAFRKEMENFNKT
jgi:hypothetical protein